MRRIIVKCAGAALFMAIAFLPPSVQAMTIAAPAGLAKAAQPANLTQDVAYVCRWGSYWRYQGCWWTPGYASYSRPYYAYADCGPYAHYRYAYYPDGYYPGR